MNKTWLGVIGAILAILLIVWLVGGSKISCHESFWDKDKQVIEIKR
jgi:CDP-diglyceride synthetase